MKWTVRRLFLQAQTGSMFVKLGALYALFATGAMFGALVLLVVLGLLGWGPR